MVLAQNLGQIRCNVVKKVKNGHYQYIFFIFYFENVLRFPLRCHKRYKLVVVKVLEWKFKANIARKDVGTKLLHNFVKKWQKMIIFKNFALFSLKVSKLIIIILSLSFLTKILFKESFIWAFWVQYVVRGWVKNGKGCFYTCHLTTNPVFSKNKVLNNHSLLADVAN